MRAKGEKDDGCRYVMALVLGYGSSVVGHAEIFGREGDLQSLHWNPDERLFP